MKKIMNNPENIVDEMIQGIVYSYDGIVKRLDSYNVIQRTAAKTDRVAVVSGGGSGHEPAHAGFVGKGMLSAAVCGAVFTSPTPDQILAAIKAADEGAGVLLIIKNYAGDVMNFEMAMEMAALENIEVRSVIVDDDIAVEDSTFTQGRRGVAGTVFVHKIIGYYAEQGKSLADLTQIAHQLVANIHSIGLALTGATVPEVGKPGFVLADDEIEYGVGIHGEPGYRREKMQNAAGLVNELGSKLLQSFESDTSIPYGVLINGFGATPLMEQFVFAKEVADLLNEAAVDVQFKKVGNYMTSIDMAGISLTLIRLEDAEWLTALKAPVETIAW